MTSADLRDFDDWSAGASKTRTVQCSALEIDGHVMIKGRPCKIIEMSTSNTEVHLVALDIFTGEKLEDTCPSTQNMDVPKVEQKYYQLLDIDDGFCNLMGDYGEAKDDMKIPGGDLGDEIRTKHNNGDTFLVTILTACGKQAIVGISVSSNHGDFM